MTTDHEREERMTGEIHAGPRPVATERLYQLPNGSWVMPGDVRQVHAFDKGDGAPWFGSAYVKVVFRDGTSIFIPFDFHEEACAARDRIARDVSPPDHIVGVP